MWNPFKKKKDVSITTTKNKVLDKVMNSNRNEKIIACYKENKQWLQRGDWTVCHGCDWTSNCERLRKKVVE